MQHAAASLLQGSAPEPSSRDRLLLILFETLAGRDLPQEVSLSAAHSWQPVAPFSVAPFSFEMSNGVPAPTALPGLWFLTASRFHPQGPCF